MLSHIVLFTGQFAELFHFFPLHLPIKPDGLACAGSNPDPILEVALIKYFP